MKGVMNPVYLEHCATCGHTQNWHIGVTGAYLNGYMVACRFPGCKDACERWVSTW